MAYHENLQILIQERKAYRRSRCRAEQKRLEDLKLIESWNGKNEDERNPLRICPKEMWLEILNYLIEVDDMKNASKTCTLFNDLLQKRKFSEILFAEVLEVKMFQRQCELLKTIDIDENENLEPEQAVVVEDNDGNTRQKPKTLLVLRSVCKSWRNVVDRWTRRSVESVYSSFCTTDDFDYPSRAALKRPLKLAFPSYNWQEKTQRLISDFDKKNSSSAKRFPCGSIKVGIFPAELDFDINLLFTFIDSVTEVLKLVGNQLWEFGVDIFNTEYALNDGWLVEEIHEMIMKWIKLTPNVEKLNIKLLIKNIFPSSRESFVKIFSSHTFPTLGKLKALKFVPGTTPGYSSKIIEGVITSNRQVEELVTELDLEEMNEEELELPENIMFTTVNVSPIPHTLEQINKFLSPTWPLKKFSFQLRNKQMRISDLFRTLNQFQTLERLQLRLIIVKNEHYESRYCDLDLPNLIEFRVYHKYDITGEREREWNKANLKYVESIDYLIKCKSIESIIWKVCSRDRQFFLKNIDRSELIQFRSGFANFESSNIWGIFPFLKSVNVVGEPDYMSDSFYHKCFTRPD